MAIDRVPALKRCRALGLEPAVIGRSKESKRQLADDEPYVGGDFVEY